MIIPFKAIIPDNSTKYAEEKTLLLHFASIQKQDRMAQLFRQHNFISIERHFYWYKSRQSLPERSLKTLLHI